MSADEAVIDTNVLIDAMVEEARNHAQASKLVGSLKKMFIPSIVLYETVWVLRKLDLAPGKVNTAIEAIVRNPKTSVVPDDGNFAVDAIRRVVAEEAELANFDDKIVLATALKLARPVATYDRELRRQASQAGISILG